MFFRLLARNARSCSAKLRTSGGCRFYASNIDLYDDIVYRGFVHHVTRPERLQAVLHTESQAVYAGVDPTAGSLHIGHLIPLMCLLHFHLRGHKIVPLIGGATGLLGDPSGRQTERQLADVKQVENNVLRLTKSVGSFFQRALDYALIRMPHGKNLHVKPTVMSNLRWHQDLSLLDFLRSIGVHARVNTMLNRESVRARLASQRGLSFAEFTYQLLQAYDFYHLHQQFGCTIQIGGSDQWGNILAGIELIGRLKGTIEDQAFGMTTPLLTTTSGEKFGKSAGNAIWLDLDMTSAFDFYQYFIQADDGDVEKYLKLFTLLPHAEIANVMEAHKESPEARVAQRLLAAEVTEMVHTTAGLAHAQTLTQLLFGSSYDGLTASQIISAFTGDQRLVILHEEELFESTIVKLAAKYRLVPSTSASRNLVQARGLYVNNRTVPELQYKVSKTDLIDGQVAVLRAGKDKFLILAAPYNGPTAYHTLGKDGCRRSVV